MREGMLDHGANTRRCGAVQGEITLSSRVACVTSCVSEALACAARMAITSEVEYLERCGGSALLVELGMGSMDLGAIVVVMNPWRQISCSVEFALNGAPVWCTHTGSMQGGKPMVSIFFFLARRLWIAQC